MFLSILRFECSQQLKSPLFIIVAAVFFTMAFLAMASEQVTVGGGTANLDLNASFKIVQSHYVFSIILMFAAVAFVAAPLTRDRELRTEEMLVATGVSPHAFFAGRFVGGYLFAVLTGIATILGTLLGSLMPWLDQTRIHRFALEPYLYSLWAVMIPTLFVVAAIVAVVAATTRSLMASYVTLVGLFIGYVVALANTDNETIRITALIDPFGLLPFGLAARYWTALEKNIAVPAMTGVLLYNRLIWLSIGAVAVAVGAMRFAFTPAALARKRRPVVASAGAAPATALGADVRPRFDRALPFQQLLSQVRMDLRGVTRTYPFYVLLAFALMNVTFNFYGSIKFYGTPLMPVTRMMLLSIAGSYLFIVLIILIYYAGELVHRERQTRVAEYLDAMPFPNWVIVAAKLVTLWFVVAMVLAISMIAAMIVQALHGYTHFEIPVYLFDLFVVQGALPFLLCVMAIAIQTIVESRFVGMLAVVAIFLGLGVLPSLGFEHVLYGMGPPQTPLSDMNGWGHFVEPLLTVTAYWAAIMTIVGIGAHLLMRRGVVGGWHERLAVARARLTGPVRVATSVAFAFALALGTFVFYNTNVLNVYRTAKDEDRLQAEYEKRFKQYAPLPMPEPIDIDANVDIFPAERRVESRGRAVLENTHSTPIDEIHVTIPRMLTVNALSIDGGTLVENDAELGYRRYRLDAPLAPGARTTATWNLSWLNRGFVNARSTTRVVGNGTFVDSERIFPTLGYARGAELQDKSKRRKYDLPRLERVPKYDDAGDLAPSMFNVTKRAAFRTTISTSPDQIAVAPGYLQREWTAEGRRYFEYQMDAPIWPYVSFTSARYAVARGRWHDVAIEVYYHPPHEYNVARMIEATQKSLDYFTREFSPYQYRQFRVIEFPGYETFAESFPNTIPYSEAIGFVADLRDPKYIDYVFYVTAHELAHQWWGHQVVGRYAQGQTFLVETLAQYSALMVMEHEYGPHQMRRFLKYELDRYLRDRGSVEQMQETPLALVEDQGYIRYQKGSVVMYALKDAIGEDAVNRALREFLAKYAFKETPFPRSRDLIDLFRAEARPDQQALIDDLFEKIVLWDLEVTDATSEALPDGRYRVKMTVRAAKRESDGAGHDTEVPLDEPLDVGVYPKAPPDIGDNDLPEPLLFQTVPIHSGENRLEYVVAGKPAKVGIDPMCKRIDRNPEDNLKTVN